MYNVLIVDEEEHLLWALEKNLFPERDDIAISTATNGEDGFEALRTQSVDLLVSDIKMPGKIDGFQLILRAKEVAPEARVIIMTAFGTNRIQNFADRIGITHYIEKPFNVGELRDAILEILDEKEGFQGVLSDLELTDIIQMLCLAKRTALLHLKHKSHRGKIVFEKGEVTHSEFDGEEGDEAVFRMLALRQGDIFMQSDFENHQKSVTMSWQDLLFEGVKRADEAGLSEDDSEYDEPDDNTDTGMGVSEEEVDAILSEANEAAAEEELVSFFSDEELEEIERASEAAVEGELEERENTDQHSRPTVMAESVATAEEAEEIVHAAATEEKSSQDDERTVVAPSAEDLDDDEFRGPFTTENSGLLRALSDNTFTRQLEEFARDCPGLRITGVVDRARGMALDFVELAKSDYDPDEFAVFFGEVIAAAERTVRAVNPSDELKEFQLALDDEFVIVRTLAQTSYVHVAVVDRETSLGVALVMMRRFEKTLNGD